MTDFSNKPLTDRQMEEDLMDSFAAFVASKWEDDFCHSYHITCHTSWNRWKKLGHERAEERWYCNSISQAADHYSWTGNDAVEQFEIRSLNLRTAIENKDDSAAYKICLDIFKWGGVGRKYNDKSVIWITERYQDLSLCRLLVEAHALLIEQEVNLDVFDGNNLLMNSAMTKVYAAIDPSKLIIYDGRVGAALGLLARDYLQSIYYTGPLPKNLTFAWGAAQGVQVRNPSDKYFKFPQLFSVGNMRHAEMMRHASYLLGKVATLIAPSSPCDLARLERALFMIGYDVSRSA